MSNEKSLPLTTMKQWLDTQPHLPAIEDWDIGVFLHSNYNDLEKTKTAIENYYTFRTTCKAFFENQDLLAEDMQTMMAISDFAPLPKATPDGYKVTIFRLADTDASKFSQNSFCKFLTICMDAWLKEDGLAEGHITIYDMTGAHLGHLARLGIFPTKNYLYFIQEALPIRMRGLHLTNTVSFVDKILVLMKPFMKRELYDVLHLHSSDESLFSFVPQECLPQEYGGNAGSIKKLKDAFYAKLLANRDAIIRDEQIKRVDESKRPTRGYSLFSVFRR